MKVHHAIDVAYGLLSLSEPDKGDIVSNLKMQKLLYYAQGLHLAMFKQPFFEENVVAWQYGPVVPEVYHEFKKYGSNMIEPNTDFKSSEVFEDDQLELLSEIYEVFGQFSAVKLMEMTHNESPWMSTSINDVISHQKMSEYCQTLIING